MSCFALLDVAGPSALILMGQWIFLFIVVGFLIIIASVFVIRAELKAVKKAYKDVELAEKEALETTANGNAENAEADQAKE